MTANEPRRQYRRPASRLARHVGVDRRALAALRVALGTLVLADLWLRSRHLVAHYTDHGVLPRAALRATEPWLAAASLHTLSGDPWIQGLLFVLTGSVALALAVGYRTTAATAATLALVVSLQFRNPMVLNGGDTLLRHLLFWGLFLPLGDRWSVDALRDGTGRRSDDAGSQPATDPDRVATLATAGLLLQVVVVYTVNAVLKLQSDLWRGGVAVRYVFDLDQFTVLFGDALAGHPALLEAVAHVWLGMVTCSVLLVVLTGWPRFAFTSAFATAHLGMALTMRLGLFPLVSIVALLPFVPSPVWDRVERVVDGATDRVASDGTTGRNVSGAAARVARLGDRLGSRGGPLLPSTLRRWLARVAPVVVALALVAMLAWNAASLAGVGPADGDGDIDGSENRWSMFAPEPLRTDGWYVVPARTESGRQVDAFHGSSVTWERPPDLADAYPSARWRKYLTNLRYVDRPVLRRSFARHLCWRWDRRHASDLASLRVVYVEEPSRLGGPDPRRRVELGSYSCGALGE